MKTLIYSLTMLFFASTYALAQQSGIGIKFGLNMATVGGDATGVKSRYDFHGGLIYPIATGSEKFMLQPELIFSSEGAKIAGTNLRAKYNYINLPVMVKFFPGKVFSLQAGPQLGVLLWGNLTQDSDKLKITDSLNDIIFSMAFGAGVDTKGGFSLSIRYNLGLNNNTLTTNNGEKFTNQVLQISIGGVL